MLSRKVICAITILNELYCARLDLNTGCRALRRTTLAEHCESDSLTFRRVVQRLNQSNCVDIVKTSIILTCDPSQMTIYELFVILHGGIPLGEEVELEAGRYTEHRNPKLSSLEADVAEVSRKYFERRTVASMISKRHSYRKRSIEQ